MSLKHIDKKGKKLYVKIILHILQMKKKKERKKK